MRLTVEIFLVGIPPFSGVGRKLDDDVFVQRKSPPVVENNQLVTQGHHVSSCFSVDNKVDVHRKWRGMVKRLFCLNQAAK